MDPEVERFDDVATVSLAGLPCAGKTTFCTQLCNMDSNFKAFKAPSISFVEGTQLEPSKFVALQCQRIKEFGAFLKPIRRSNPSCIIVCDRGIEDILCYTHFVLKVKLGLDASSCSELLRGIPNSRSRACIFLSTKKSVLDERENHRAKPSSGRGLANQSEYWSFYQAWFLSRPWIIPLVTDHLDIAGACEHLASVIRRNLQGSEPPHSQDPLERHGADFI
jgi:hypothetical protein